MYGTLGEVLTERSGNLNLGVEGIMFMGGAFGLGGVFYYEQAVGEARIRAQPSRCSSRWPRPSRRARSPR